MSSHVASAIARIIERNCARAAIVNRPSAKVPKGDSR
jgi:hypothetical protein